MDALYNRICVNYDTTRKADPDIVKTLLTLLKPEPRGHYVDIACGTGNYTQALKKGTDTKSYWHGFDQSAKMLAQAREKSANIEWNIFDVTQTQYPNQTFDGATCILAVHHFKDVASAFTEIWRILKPGAKLVIFTSTPEQMQHYWLANYFPALMEQSCAQMPSLQTLKQALEQSRFTLEKTNDFFITPELQDFFLYSGKQRPDMYLSEAVRAGISSFANFSNPNELAQGLTALTADIQSGRIQTSIATANKYSDYLFVVAQRQ
jgi:ubiquinone/menaquinone biosynthesis C-methylase UbiE